MQGYERTVQSAQAILTFLEEHFEVDAFLKQAIEAFWSEDCS
jgi:hypothetical protein